MQMLMKTRELLGRILSRGESLISALLGQASSSISSVLVSAWLIYFGPKEQFGVYSLCFSISLVCAGMISSGLTIQFAVHLPSKAMEERAASLNAYLVIIATLCAVGVALSIAIDSSDLFSSSFLGSILICGAMTWAISSRELILRYMVHQEDHRGIRTSSIILLATTLGLLLIQQPYFPRLYWATLAYATGILISLMPCFLKNRKGISQVSAPIISAALTECWHGGRWGIVSNAFFSIRNQAHTLLLAPLGPSVVADVNAARLAFMPMYQIAPVISQIGLSAVAKLRSTNELEAVKYGRRLAKLAIIPILAFGVLISVCAILLKNVIIPEEYWNSTNYLLGWCLVTSAMAGRIAYSTTLQALHQFKSVASGNIASIFALFATWFVLKGATGAPAILYAMAGSEAFVMLIYMRKLSTIESGILRQSPHNS
ncbi:hypothetical protein D3C71_874010 [compost metagenome]